MTVQLQLTFFQRIDARMSWLTALIGCLDTEKWVVLERGGGQSALNQSEPLVYARKVGVRCQTQLTLSVSHITE